MAECVEASKLDLIQLVFPLELVFHRGMWSEDNRKLKYLHMVRNRRVSVGTERDAFLNEIKIRKFHRMRKLCAPINSHFNKMNTQ